MPEGQGKPKHYLKPVLNLTMNETINIPLPVEPGSQPLDNIKHENFVFEILKGRDRSTAYRNAGFNPKNDNSAQACAADLLKKPKIKARMNFLQRKTAEAVCVTKAEVIKKLWFNGLQCMGELPVKVSKIRLKDKESGEYSVKTIEVYERDPSAANKAFEMVGREFGMFEKGGDVDKPGDYSGVPADKLMVTILEMVNKASTYREKLKALPLPQAPSES